MKIPFGDYKGQELNVLPNSLLSWIRDKMKAQPPITVKPENREAMHRDNVTMKHEAARILQERARNGVYIKDTRREKTARNPITTPRRFW